MRPRDTSPEAWKVFIEAQRRLSPEEKLRQCFEWSEFVRQLALAGCRLRNPQAGEREIFLREARHRLGRELFHQAYGNELPDDQPPRRDA